MEDSGQILNLSIYYATSRHYRCKAYRKLCECRCHLAEGQVIDH